MKNGIKRVLIILFLIVLIAAISIVIYSVTTHKNVLGELISNIKKENKEDYHNGVYYYEKPLGKSYNVYSGCNVSSFTTYIVVMNDKYLVYEGSCLRTIKVSEGKTEDLVFSIDKETNKYQVNYDDKVFKKNDIVNSIVVSNKLKNKYDTSNLETLDFIIDVVETEGDYFPINVKLAGSVKKYTLKFEYDETNKYFVETILSNLNVVYTRHFPKKEDRPSLYLVNNNVAVLEKDLSNPGTDNFMYKYNLILITNEKAFDLRKEFPIVINGERIDINKNIFITKGKNNTFRMLVGNENTFCNEDKKESDEISYYEFVIKYNFSTDNLDSPELVKIGRYNEGCGYVNKYFLGG